MKIKNYILIDTENIGSYTALQNMVETDFKDQSFNIVLFKSVNSKPVKADYWDLLFNKSDSAISIDVVGTGNQNMDIQIASYAGYLISKNKFERNSSYSEPKICIYLYSNDNHLENCSDFLQKVVNNFEIKHLKEPTVKSNHLIASTKKFVLTEELIVELSKLTPFIDIVIYEVNKNKKLDTLHNELAKRLPNGKEIYKLIKNNVNYS